MHMIVSRAVAAACVLALLAAGSTATANPTPPCRRLSATDALNDITFFNPAPAAAVRPSYDLEGLYFRSNAVNGAYSGTTAHVQVANLDGAVPKGSTSARWSAIWTDSMGDERFVSAKITLASGVVDESVIF